MHTPRTLLLSLAVGVAIGTSGCRAGTPTARETGPDLSTLTYQGPWLEAGFSFGHDGEPWVGEHFTVYSGFSSQTEREYVARAMEGHFEDLRGAFDIEGLDELDGWVEGTTIPVLSLRFQGTDVPWTGQSYRYGLIVHAPDSPRYAREGYTRTLYDQLLRHELMHVVEYYLVGRTGTYSSVEKWFHEGIATVMGGEAPNRIVSADALRQWRDDMDAYPGSGNPIDIRTNADYPTALQSDVEKLGRFYLAFELAVRYLLDPAGAGRTSADVKAMYLDIRDGVSFRDAFREHMGFSVESYEVDFYSLMEAYLG